MARTAQTTPTAHATPTARPALTATAGQWDGTGQQDITAQRDTTGERDDTGQRDSTGQQNNTSYRGDAGQQDTTGQQDSTQHQDSPSHWEGTRHRDGTGQRDGTRHQDGNVSGYRLVVPDGWFAVDLEPGRRERSVAALVKRQFAGIDNAPHLKAQARRELLAQAEAAHEAGGLEMFLSLQQIAGIPLTASLVVFLVPPPGTGAVTTQELARSLSSDERRVTVVDLPAGEAVRVLSHLSSPDQSDSATLKVFVPVPHTGEWLLLTFATPLGPLFPALTKLFDAICTTLRWDQ